MRSIRLFSTLFDTRAPTAIVLVRLMVGSVFASEGIQKFLFPAALGVGRFAKIGFPYPGALAHLAGTFESTKLPILLGSALGPFQPPATGPFGFWAMAHEARTDWSMLLGLIFLGIVGSGRWLWDARLASRPTVA
jgi:uncharacterized membrane protein YphA (DoxX/SURF4 family)